MKYIKNGLMLLGIIAIAGVLIQAVSQAPAQPTHYQSPTSSSDSLNVVHDYNIYALPIPKKMNFAGEPVPLKNPDIRERLDHELLVNVYWQSNMLLLLKRAHKYFPIIEPILKEYGVPEDFKYLAVAESALLQVVSPAGATGFWQFMESTGRSFDLEINDNIDERYNIEKATVAACKYLKKSYERFGSWTLAAAAYNAGNYGVSHQQERQGVTNYYDLLLGTQTSRYVFRIIALKEIMSHPHKYGFNFNEDDLYDLIPTRRVVVDSSVADFARFAKHFGINYKILKIHNPWLREAQLENSEGYRYEIKIPKKGYYTYKP